MAGVRMEGVHVRDSGWRARYDFVSIISVLLPCGSQGLN